MVAQDAVLRERIGLASREMDGTKCPQQRADLAKLAGRSERTIRAWNINPWGGRPGRPPQGPEKHERARRLVLSELRLQGWEASTAAIDRALKPRGVPTRLTREWVRTIKQQIAADDRAYAQERATRVVPVGPDVMVALDTTFVCREPEETPTNGEVAVPSEATKGLETPRVREETGASVNVGSPEIPGIDVGCEAPEGVATPGPEGGIGPSVDAELLVAAAFVGAVQSARRRRGRAVQAVMAIDVATMLKLGAKVVRAPRAGDVIELLLAIRARRGVFPLVVVLDNGPENANDAVKQFLKENQIVGLYNLPRTPKHNPAIERSHREVKAEAALDLQVLDPSVPLPERVRAAIERALRRLNNRLRASRGWKTAAQLDSELSRPYTVIARDDFYAAASAAMRAAREMPGTARQKRLAERWALYAVMEAFGLIKIFRGGVQITALKTEGIT